MPTFYDINAVLKARRKLIFIVFFGLLLLSVYLIYTSYGQSIAIGRTEVLKRLHSITKTMMPHMPAEVHTRILSKYRDMDGIKASNQDPDYERLHLLLKSSAQANLLKTPIYTLVKAPDGGFFFGVTSQEKPYFRHPYKTAPAALRTLYKEGGMIGPYGDQHGTWLSAFSPIKNKQGTVVAILQADQKFDEFLAQAKSTFMRDISVSFVVAFLLSLLLYFLFSRASADFLQMFRENEKFSSQLREANEQLQRQNEEISLAVDQKTEALKAKELAHASLKASQQQLVEAEKMASLGRLVAGVAHEINTPIGVGVTAASHLQDASREFAAIFEQGKMKKSDLQKLITTNTESASIILFNLKRAAELVSHFKQVSVDRTSERKRAFEVNQTINELMTSLRPTFKEGGHTIEFKYSGELVCDGYPGAFGQVLTNLMMNSVIHAYDKGQGGHLLIETELDGDFFRVECSDDGKGISEQDFPHIFEPFFTTKRGQGGTGLGLHLTYNIVTQALQGSIECESKVGVGTMFILRIPLVIRELVSDGQEEQRVSRFEVLSKRSKAKVREDRFQQTMVMNGLVEEPEMIIEDD